MQCIQRTPNSEYESCPKSPRVRLDPETRPTYSKKFKNDGDRPCQGGRVRCIRVTIPQPEEARSISLEIIKQAGTRTGVFRAGYWQAKRTAAMDRNGAGPPYFKNAE